jgi:hypothetical protein
MDGVWHDEEWMASGKETVFYWVSAPQLNHGG